MSIAITIAPDLDDDAHEVARFGRLPLLRRLAHSTACGWPMYPAVETGPARAVYRCHPGRCGDHAVELDEADRIVLAQVATKSGMPVGLADWKTQRAFIVQRVSLVRINSDPDAATVAAIVYRST
ncbi:MAG: hypothetical protein ACRD0P_37405 [Stackebrandtia sp.]